ncbi:MAG: alpha/beta hydrolase [Aquificae bacterium]|jgi:3-oxoadipate enol-lactonase|nr:alpha/beta hydrolase [Aquificota bacterium]
MRVFSPKAVLFLHPFPVNKNIFKAQFEALERESIPYVAVDYPGFGEERNFPSEYTIQMLTDIIVSKISQLGVKGIIPVGVSMGGYIMFDLWRRYSHLIDGLVFSATRYEADTEEGKRGRLETIQRIKEEGLDFLIEFMLVAQTSPKTRTDEKKMLALECLMRQATPEGVINALKALADRPDNSDVLPTIDVPTVVIAGKDDEQITPPEVVKRIADGIKGAKFYQLPNSAHLPPFENPEEFNKILINFVKEIWG